MRIAVPVLLICAAGLVEPVFAKPYAYQITTGSTLSIFQTQGLTETGAIGLPGPIQFFTATPNGADVFLANDCCGDPYGSFWGTAQASLIRQRLVRTLQFSNSEECGPMVVSPDGTKLYISNSLDSTITVVSVATGSVIQTISNLSANANYTSDLHISADGTTLYAALGPIDKCPECGAASSNPTPLIVTIDASTGTIESQFPVSGAGTIAVTADGAYAYYTAGTSGSPGSTIGKLDLKTGITSVTITAETNSLALSSDGSELYAGYATISVISTATDAVTGQISLANAGTISGIALDPTSNTGYAAYYNSVGVGYLAAFDRATQTVTVTEDLSGTPGLISLSANGAELYVGLTSPTLISVINTTLGAVTGSIETQFPVDISLSPGNTVLYAIQGQTYLSGVSLVAIDALTFKHLGTASVPGRQITPPVLVSPDGTKLYVGTIPQTGVGPQDLEVLNAATLTLESVLPITGYNSVVLSADGHYLYFDTSVNVSKFDLGTNQLVATLTLPDSPSNGLAILPSGKTLYVGLGLITDGSIAVVSTSALTLTSVLPYCGADLAVSPSGSTLYGTGCSSPTTPIYELSTTTGKLERTFDFNFSASGIAVPADGQSLYMPGFLTEPSLKPGVSVLNIATGAASFIPSYSFSAITLAN